MQPQTRGEAKKRQIEAGIMQDDAIGLVTLSHNPMPAKQ
jgi:hypothetical protein